jgi:cytochrome c556
MYGSCYLHSDELNMRIMLLACAGVAALGLIAGAGAQSPDSGVIVTRQNGQDLVGALTGDMKRAVAAKEDVKPYAEGAKAISRWSLQFPTLFPPGSEKGQDTKALPAIWSDRPGFEKAAVNLSEAAAKLAATAMSDDKAAFADQFDAMTKACSACHRKYKAKSE